MPGPISESYRGPKDNRVPTWYLRGGPDRDYPCCDPTVTECALSDCQHLGHCKLDLPKFIMPQLKD